MKKTIIYFDGICSFCDSFVSFVFKNSKRGAFYFSLLQKSKFSNEDLKSVIVENDNQILKNAKAIKFILLKINYPYRLIGYLLYFIPNFIISYLYKIFAKYRYKIFGKKDKCFIPSAEEKEFFIN